METVKVKRHRFGFCHPAVLFIYFFGAVAFTMITMHPVFTAISFLAGSSYAIYLKGLRGYLKSLIYYSVIFLAVTAGNAFFGGLGLSVIFYFGGTPVTWESVGFGLCSGGMLVAVLQWFACYQQVMTSDKFLTLFDRVMPTIAMMLAMIFRYIPDMIRKAREISAAQAALIGMEGRSGKRKVKQGVRLASVLMGWTMENSMETADSMLARGYGSRKRSRYSGEKLTGPDIGLLVFLGGLGVMIACIIAVAVNRFAFYPRMKEVLLPPWMILAYALFLLLPLILQGKEWFLWKRSGL